ncbi:uncharacterized protein CTRU02_210358 [Colletotrichum truncatum]|uniref:Uncharacterized protein n=1 Tax=Colletotrichum truncatum TaxID=5467 RepID=A0ACC3YVB2_COLTU|nr:uncharacterized protein CTRU02_15305 [Colletotrichum truncatum]KAF6781210.1 hypothetical protein CTRU02_15305 [Colletotrichum truncatum]
MDGGPVVRKQTPGIQCRKKVKTGCVTCRIRRVKCDESKPFCQKCVDTGRTCDGYESPFRLVSTNTAPNNTRAGGRKSVATRFQPIQSVLELTEIEITPQDIDLLARYFSTKTMFDVKLGCNEEARQILQASLTDAPIRHAVSSLKTLREHLEASTNIVSPVVRRTPNHSYDYGLQQYCVALGGLASRLSSLGSGGLRSALLCCQTFISIEQVRGNFAAMAQHMVQGLSIMRDYRLRPRFAASDAAVKFEPAHYRQMPLIDIFIVKLFAAPCKFADLPPTTTSGTDETMAAVLTTPPQIQPLESSKLRLRTIAPDMATGLTRIAVTTLKFLDRVSDVASGTDALQLLSEKANLLESLESWHIGLDIDLSDAKPHQSEPLSVSFLRFHHQILKIVLLGALYSSPGDDAEIQAGVDQLHRIAGFVEEGSRAYRMRNGV